MQKNGMERYQFQLSRLFLLTALVGFVLMMRDTGWIQSILFLVGNAIACALCFGVPIWLASWRDH